MNEWLRKRRRKQFDKAVKILREEHLRHKESGHAAQFEALDERRVILICNYCPETQPMGRPREESE